MAKNILNRSPFLFTITFLVISSLIFLLSMGGGLASTITFFGQSVQQQQQEEEEENQQNTLQFNAPMQTRTNQDIDDSINNNHNRFNSINKTDTRISNDTILLVNIFATDLLNRLYQSATMLEITAELPQVRNISFANMLNQTLDMYHGIPPYVDVEKRQLAQNILSKNGTGGDLFELFYLMSNGDMYMLEPYTIQETLTENNYAFREYFQGAIQTNDTYLGNAIITTAASGIREAVIAVPVYSLDDNTTIVGVWAGGIDFGKINHQLQSLGLIDDNKRVVYVDSRGEKIADSNPNSSNTFESFDKLASFKNAISGETGTTVELLEVNDDANDDDIARTIISYKPVEVFHNTWVVLVMETIPST